MKPSIPVSISTRTVIGPVEIIELRKPGEATPHYTQTILRDPHGNTLWWRDSKHSFESFKISISGYNKKGEPIYQADYIDSDIVLYINGVKYPDKNSYDKERIRLILANKLKHNIMVDIASTAVETTTDC